MCKYGVEGNYRNLWIPTSYKDNRFSREINREQFGSSSQENKKISGHQAYSTKAMSANRPMTDPLAPRNIQSRALWAKFSKLVHQTKLKEKSCNRGFELDFRQATNQA
jgi:hypothetical protein